MNQTIRCIIDGLNTFIRVFSVLPTTNEDGVHVGGIVGFLRSIGYVINMVSPTRVIIVFDGKGGSNLVVKYYQSIRRIVRLNIVLTELMILHPKRMKNRT